MNNSLATIEVAALDAITGGQAQPAGDPDGRNQMTYTVTKDGRTTTSQADANKDPLDPVSF